MAQRSTVVHKINLSRSREYPRTNNGDREERESHCCLATE